MRFRRRWTTFHGHSRGHKNDMLDFRQRIYEHARRAEEEARAKAGQAEKQGENQAEDGREKQAENGGG